jgi:hypothetical protein
MSTLDFTFCQNEPNQRAIGSQVSRKTARMATAAREGYLGGPNRAKAGGYFQKRLTVRRHKGFNGKAIILLKAKFFWGRKCVI